MTQHHMSVTKQEAQFLKSILAAHLDDYVEKLVREDKDKPLEKMLKNRQVGLDLISKVEETIRRAAKAGNSTYFTKPD
jgi:NADPH:quinone reductase-like Zn-dependent oxidoreductase